MSGRDTTTVPAPMAVVLRCRNAEVPVKQLTAIRETGALFAECDARYAATLMEWLCESLPCSITYGVDGERREADPFWPVDVAVEGDVVTVEFKTPRQDAMALEDAIAKLRAVRGRT